MRVIILDSIEMVMINSLIHCLILGTLVRTKMLVVLTLPHDLSRLGYHSSPATSYLESDKIFSFSCAAFRPESGYFKALDKSSGRLGEGCRRLPQASCSTWVRCAITWGFRVEEHYPKNGEARGQEPENEMETAGISWSLRFRARAGKNTKYSQATSSSFVELPLQSTPEFRNIP